MPPSFFSNFSSIKAMTMRLRGYIVSLKMFPSRTATRSDDVISRANKVMIAKWARHLGSAILDLWIFPKL